MSQHRFHVETTVQRQIENKTIGGKRSENCIIRNKYNLNKFEVNKHDNFNEIDRHSLLCEILYHKANKKFYKYEFSH